MSSLVKLKTPFSEKMIPPKSRVNPNRGHERGLVYPFDIADLPDVLRKLAAELERIERESGYSPTSIRVSNDWSTPCRYRAEVIIEDKRWFI